MTTKPIARDPIYRRRRFEAEIIELCVRLYITCRLSHRDLVAMMADGLERCTHPGGLTRPTSRCGENDTTSTEPSTSEARPSTFC